MVSEEEFNESEAIIDGMGPMLDRSRAAREERSKPLDVPIDGVYEVDPKHFTEPYHHETQPAYGEHGAWQEWYIHHSNCGGTWVYVKEPGNDRVICSCSMGMGGSA